MFIQKKPTLFLLLVLLLSIVMLLPMASVSAAAIPVFTAMGDSTGFGLSAFPDPAERDLSTLDGFNDQFADALSGQYGGIAYTNIAMPGDKTCDLLAKLQLSAVKKQVRQSRFLTVSIGGNNLLGPSIAAIFGLWGVDPDDYYELDGRDMLADLAVAIAAKYEADPYYNPMDDFSRLMDLTDPASIAFHKALLQGVADFKQEWPAIASQIRRLNRRGEFYVTTVHNPLTVSSSADPLYPLYLKFEALIFSINLTIRGYARVYGYRVVDAYSAVRRTNGAADFDIVGAITAATAMIQLGETHWLYPSLYLQFLQKTDPHPTHIGHTAIYQQLVSVRSSTPSWYWSLR